jgi:hypothetical protein
MIHPRVYVIADDAVALRVLVSLRVGRLLERLA